MGYSMNCPRCKAQEVSAIDWYGDVVRKFLCGSEVRVAEMGSQMEWSFVCVENTRKDYKEKRPWYSEDFD